MKKRLISFLLMVVMLVSLCSVIPVSASADAQVTTVTVAKGDTVLKLCQNLGVDFYTYKDLIMKLNGFTSESAFSKLSVGAKLSLPVSNQAAANLAGTVGSTAAASGTAAAGTTGSGLTSGTVSSLPTGDYVAYYLVGYTVQKGETLSSIYANMGLSYKTYENQICKLNNLKSVNSIQAGKTILLPTTSPNVTGTGVTTVMAHAMKSNENAYNIVCSDYGLNYTSVQTMLQALNNRTNMGAFRVGELLYIPVSGVVSANTTVTPGTGSVSGSTTGSVSTSGAYNLVAQTPTNGSFDLQVGDKSVKSATSGQTVKVVTTPDAGYAVDSINVTKVGDSNTAVTVNNGSFIMPAYSVTVSVSFKQAKQSEIKVDSAVNGAVSVMVDNNVVSKAYAGNKVVVRTTPKAGFMLDNVRVTYNDYRDTIAVENSTFTMPNFDVTVTATFKVDPDYNSAVGNKIYTDITNGALTAKVGENVVESAKAGDRVTLTVTPKENYTLESLKVYCDNFKKTIAVDNMSFTMPDEPVTVVAVVKPTADAVFALNVIENTEGKVKLLVDGKEVTSAKAGQTVKIEATSSRDFYYFLSTVTKVGDSTVSVNLGEDNTFVMPDYAVDVRVKFYLYHNVVLDSSSYGLYNVTSVLTGTPVSRCAAGVNLQVNVWGVANGMAQGSIVLVYADGSRYTLTDTNQFIMPDCDVRIHVNFTKQTTLVAHSIGDDSNAYTNWGNTYSVLGRTLNDKGKYPLEIPVGRGNNVTVYPAANIGYTLDKMWYTVKGDTTKNYITYSAINGGYKFVLPDTDKVDLYVTFKEMSRNAVTIEYGHDGANVGKAVAYTALATVTEAAPNSLVWLRVDANAGYDFDWSKVVILNANETDASKKDVTKKVSFDPVEHSFTMPDYPVIIDLSAAFASNLHTIKYQRVTSATDSNVAKGTIKVTIDGTTYANFTGKDGLCTLLDGSSPMNVEAGKCVYISHESQPGFFLDHIDVKYADSETETLKVTTVNETTCYFTMPYADVVISPVYEDEYYSIVATESAHGTYTVGSIAKVGQNADNLIANIKPDDGYELGKVTLTYVNAAGVQVDEAEVKKTDIGLYYADPGLLPKSEVTVKVTFVPIKQEGLEVEYHFDEGIYPNASFNCWVDLFIGDQKLTLTRGGLKDKVDSSAVVSTDDLIVIRRSDSNPDVNFEIENIWVIYNDYNDAAERYTNGDYYFKMPNVKEGQACTIHVKFKLKNEAKYEIAAETVGGTATINGITVDGSKNISAALGSLVTLVAGDSVTGAPAAGYEYPATVTITVNGTAYTQTFNPAGSTGADGSVTYSASERSYEFGNGSANAPSITALPEGAVSVKVEFKEKPPVESDLTLSGAGKGDVKLLVDGVEATGDTVKAKSGSEIKVVLTDSAKRFKSVSITRDTGLGGGTADLSKAPREVSFPMYDCNSTVTVETELIPTNVSIDLEIDPELEVTAIDNATLDSTTGKYVVDVNSKTYPVVHVSVKEGEEAYDHDISVSVKIGGEDRGATDNGDGTWQFTVPEKTKSIKVIAEYKANKHQVNINDATTGAGISNVTMTCDDVKSTKAVNGSYLVFTAPEGKKFGEFKGSYTVLDSEDEKTVDIADSEKGLVKAGDRTAIWVQIGDDKPLAKGSAINILTTLENLVATDIP